MKKIASSKTMKIIECAEMKEDRIRNSDEGDKYAPKNIDLIH